MNLDEEYWDRVLERTPANIADDWYDVYTGKMRDIDEPPLSQPEWEEMWDIKSQAIEASEEYKRAGERMKQ